MIIGAHAIVYSKDADSDRAFLRDVLKLPRVDVGGGWLIFGLPPAEVAIHPGEHNDKHEFFLMCDDIETFVRKLSAKDIACGPVQQQRWGALTSVSLPGGGKIGVYQPFHPRPKLMRTSQRKPKVKSRKKARPQAKKRSAKTRAPNPRKARRR